jgi:hypothetical protein
VLHGVTSDWLEQQPDVHLSCTELHLADDSPVCQQHRAEFELAAAPHLRKLVCSRIHLHLLPYYAAALPALTELHMHSASPLVFPLHLRLPGLQVLALTDMQWSPFANFEVTNMPALHTLVVRPAPLQRVHLKLRDNPVLTRLTITSKVILVEPLEPTIQTLSMQHTLCQTLDELQASSTWQALADRPGLQILPYSEKEWDDFLKHPEECTRSLMQPSCSAK